MADLPKLTFPMLDSNRWQAVRKQAMGLLNNTVEKPELKDFKGDDRSPYPKLLTWSLTIALFVIMIFTFLFSSTKQVIATSQIVDSLAQLFGVDPRWLSATSIMWLFAGEIGALSFSIGSAVFPGELITIGKYTFRPYALIFRFASFLCAGVAVLANMAVTQLDPNSKIPFYQWVVTITAPLLVLAIGLLFERMILEAMVTRKENRARFDTAMAEWKLVTGDTENHPKFHEYLRSAIWDEINKSPKRKAVLESWVTVDDRYRVAIVDREIESHNLWSGTSQISLEGDSNGFLDQNTQTV
jgi:hypothetical protein